jgi:BASS family bile acid:Na+ symporter
MMPFLLLRVLTAVYVVATMLDMGIALGGQPRESKKEKRHKRKLLAAGLVLNLIILPLAALGIARGLGASGEVTSAFLLLAAAPGGRFFPPIARIAGGDLGLSVEITLFINKLVSFTAPFTAHWFLREHRVGLPELRLIGQLVLLQFLPYLVGKRLRARWLLLPLRLLQRVVLVIAGVAVVAAGDLRGLGNLSSERGWLAVLLFAVVSLIVGGAAGGRDPGARRVLALSGNARNLAVAALLASLMSTNRQLLLATFAVWAVLGLFDLAVAAWLGRRQPAEATG